MLSKFIYIYCKDRKVFKGIQSEQHLELALDRVENAENSYDWLKKLLFTNLNCEYALNLNISTVPIDLNSIRLNSKRGHMRMLDKHSAG